MKKYQCWIYEGYGSYNKTEFDTPEEAYEYGIRNNFRQDEIIITSLVKVSVRFEEGK